MTDTTASNTADSQPIISYKGFDKDFRCRGYQYAVGQTYTHDWGVDACVSGFHACPIPLSVFDYYLPAGSRFAIVEQWGEMDHENDKIASSNLTVKAEISLFDIIKAQIDWVWSNIKKDKDDAKSISSSGDQSVASNTGDYYAASCTGYWSVASNTGNYSAASVTGFESVAMVTGYESKAMASEGSWIAIVEHDKAGKIINFKTAQAGVAIKPDIFYRLKDGVFVIAETDDTEE